MWRAWGAREWVSSDEPAQVDPGQFIQKPCGHVKNFVYFQSEMGNH